MKKILKKILKVVPVKVRINKFIADSGFASRRKVEELILEGRVEVNNTTILSLATQVDPEKDTVMVDGEKIKPKRHLYFILHKPKGVITTTDDERARKTVVDLIKTKEKIFPVGRLDYDTTGILFLTNDGDFSNYLTHPSNFVTKEYKVKLNRPLESNDKTLLTKGIKLDGKNSRFQSVMAKDKSFLVWAVKTNEGRNHFVKRMFAKIGYRVPNCTGSALPDSAQMQFLSENILKLMRKS